MVAYFGLFWGLRTSQCMFYRAGGGARAAVGPGRARAARPRNGELAGQVGHCKQLCPPTPSRALPREAWPGHLARLPCAPGSCERWSRPRCTARPPRRFCRGRRGRGPGMRAAGVRRAAAYKPPANALLRRGHGLRLACAVSSPAAPTSKHPISPAPAALSHLSPHPHMPLTPSSSLKDRVEGTGSGGGPNLAGRRGEWAGHSGDEPSAGRHAGQAGDESTGQAGGAFKRRPNGRSRLDSECGAQRALNRRSIPALRGTTQCCKALGPAAGPRIHTSAPTHAWSLLTCRTGHTPGCPTHKV